MLKSLKLSAYTLPKKISAIVASDIFLWLILIFFVVQAGWVAVSFKYPMIFDEVYHFGIIQYFSSHPNILSTTQSPQYDLYGNIAYGNASLYHYTMVLPYELISRLTTSFQAQIIALRFLNIFMVAGALLLFRQIFIRLGSGRALANLTLLFYTLIPLVLLVAATISYDNMMLPFVALFILLGVKIVQSKKYNLIPYVEFLGAGMLACLVKFTFLPVFAAGVLFMAIWGYRQYRTKKPDAKETVRPSFRFYKQYSVALIIIVMVLGVLFAARYVVAVARFHSPIPDCAKVLSESRCLKNWNYAVAEKALATKEERLPYLFGEYVEKWAQTINMQFDTSGSSTIDSEFQFGKALPLFSLLISAGLYLGTAVLIYMWRSLPGKTTAWYFAFIVSMTLIFSTFLFNALTYYAYNQDLNIQTRYLLGAVPIILFMVIFSINLALKNYLLVKLVVIFIVLALCTQGAGVIKHIVTSNESWYWGDAWVTDTNQTIRDVLKPVIKERR